MTIITQKDDAGWMVTDSSGTFVTRCTSMEGAIIRALELENPLRHENGILMSFGVVDFGHDSAAEIERKLIELEAAHAD